VELYALAGRYDLSDSAHGPIKLKNKGDYFQAGILIPIEFSAKSVLSVDLYYTKGINNYFLAENGIKQSNPDAIGCCVFQLSFSRSF